MEEANRIIKETWLSRKPSSWALLVATISTFLLVLGCGLYWQNVAGLTDLMTASHETLFTKHQWWRAWSTLFAHADQKHLLSNVLMFYTLGYFLEGYFGVLIFPLAAFFFGGVINFFVLNSSAPDLQVIGASGIVFWMGGAWLSLYFALDRRRTILQRTLRSIGVALLLFMPAEAFDPSISYRSHLIGFLLGVLFGFFYFLLRREHFRSAEVTEIVVETEDYPNSQDPLSELFRDSKIPRDIDFH